MEQHKQTLEEARQALIKDGYRRWTGNTAEYAQYGEWPDVVNMAFSALWDADIDAAYEDYKNEVANAKKAQARASYETIRDLAAELHAMTRPSKRLVAVDDETGITEVAAEFEDELAELRENDAWMHGHPGNGY